MNENGEFVQKASNPASLPVGMNNDIAQLLEFHDRCGHEVIGHGAADLDPKQKRLIERFVVGHCDDAERRELSEFLLRNPNWIRWIAERIRSERPDAQLSNES